MKKFLLILLVLVIGLGVASVVVSKDYSVSRSVVIESDPETVREVLADFNYFTQWDRWSKMDPNIEFEYFGTPGEVGHGYKWSGNEDVGSGSMEIKSISDNSIDIEWKFMEPMEATSPTSYTINSVTGGTEVIWSMKGSVPYFVTFMGDMEAELGSNFEDGLNGLKTIVEEMEPAYEITQMNMPDMHFVGVRETISMDDMDDFWSADNVGALFGRAGAVSNNVGYLAGLYYTWDEEAGETDMARAVIVSEPVNIPGFTTMTVEGGSALKLTHYGSYDEIGAAHRAMEEYMMANNIQFGNGPAMEIYRVAGEDVAEEDQVTDVVYPIAPPAAS